MQDTEKSEHRLINEQILIDFISNCLNNTYFTKNSNTTDITCGVGSAHPSGSLFVLYMVGFVLSSL